ncbi:MAG: hypothetical protein ACJAQT_002365 [Akkermansiaceae bacterium]|jgi:hypothetical protein
MKLLLIGLVRLYQLWDSFLRMFNGGHGHCRINSLINKTKNSLATKTGPLQLEVAGYGVS